MENKFLFMPARQIFKEKMSDRADVKSEKPEKAVFELRDDYKMSGEKFAKHAFDLIQQHRLADLKEAKDPTKISEVEAKIAKQMKNLQDMLSKYLTDIKNVSAGRKAPMSRESWLTYAKALYGRYEYDVGTYMSNVISKRSKELQAKIANQTKIDAMAADAQLKVDLKVGPKTKLEKLDKNK